MSLFSYLLFRSLFHLHLYWILFYFYCLPSTSLLPICLFCACPIYWNAGRYPGCCRQKASSHNRSFSSLPLQLLVFHQTSPEGQGELLEHSRKEPLHTKSTKRILVSLLLGAFHCQTEMEISLNSLLGIEQSTGNREAFTFTHKTGSMHISAESEIYHSIKYPVN